MKERKINHMKKEDKPKEFYTEQGEEWYAKEELS